MLVENKKMKNNIAIICKNHIRTEIDNPESDPPPGKEIANSLLNIFSKTENCKVRNTEVEDDDWEHSYWFIWVFFKNEEYRLHIDSPIETNENNKNLWMISIYKEMNFFKKLFTKETDVNNEFKNVIESIIENQFTETTIKWLTDNQTSEILEY